MENLQRVLQIQLQHRTNKMDKKKAIVNTLLGKIQARSAKLYEDVNEEIWDFDPEAEKDCNVSIDGEEVKEEDDDVEEVKALDVILDAPVNTDEKEVTEE